MACVLFEAQIFWLLTIRGLGSCTLTGLGSLKKKYEKREILLLPLVCVLSGFWGDAEEKEKKYSCYYSF